jgi:Coenzyme PQQ synthesis protein D (PqqD)
MNTTKPIRKPDIIAQDLGGETLLCSPEAKTIHILNPTAWRIWELCNGEHSVEDMVEAIRARFSVPNGRDVIGDIRRTLEIFTSKGLLKKNNNLMEPPEGGTWVQKTNRGG